MRWSEEQSASSLSASASSVVSDLWLPSCSVPPSESRQVWTTRLLTIFFGGLQIAIGVWASTFNKSVIDNALTIAGFSSGILLGLFALGTFTKRANQVGALCGATIGLCVMLFIQFGLPLWDLKIAGTLLAVFGSVTTYFSGLGISLVTGPTLERTNP